MFEDDSDWAALAAAVRLRWQGRQRVSSKQRVEYSATRRVTGVPQAQRGLVVDTVGPCPVAGVAAGVRRVAREARGAAGVGGVSVACVVLAVLGCGESGAGAGAPLVGAVWSVAA